MKTEYFDIDTELKIDNIKKALKAGKFVKAEDLNCGFPKFSKEAIHIFNIRLKDFDLVSSYDFRTKKELFYSKKHKNQ